jgi:hypothetical protein
MLHNGVDNLSGLRDSINGGQPHTIISEVTSRSIRTRTYVRRMESFSPHRPKEYFTNLWGAITHEVSRAAGCVEPSLRQYANVFFSV